MAQYALLARDSGAKIIGVVVVPHMSTFAR